MTASRSEPLPGVLRRAAAEMVRRAEAAMPGPWWTGGQEIASLQTGRWVGDTCDVGEGEHTEGNARHVTAWHPGVAIRVADLLNTVADEYERARPCADGCPNQGEMTYSWWLAWSLAQAYLGDPGLPPPARRPEPGRVEAPTVEETRLASALASAMSETTLQSCVIDYARLRGWLAVHFRPAQNDRGIWRTPIEGDPGFPDTVLVRGGRVVFAELKSARGVVGPEQRAWLTALGTAGPPVEVYQWRPVDWLDGTIRAVLDRLADGSG